MRSAAKPNYPDGVASRTRRRSRGFTIVEALVSVAILSVGIVATLTTLREMAKAQTRSLEREEMQRLALRKYDEILALDQLPSGSSRGSFESVGEPNFAWRADRGSSGVENLDYLRVEVSRREEDFSHPVEVQGLIAASGGTQ